MGLRTFKIFHHKEHEEHKNKKALKTQIFEFFVDFVVKIKLYLKTDPHSELPIFSKNWLAHRSFLTEYLEQY